MTENLKAHAHRACLFQRLHILKLEAAPRRAQRRHVLETQRRII